jgi:hypothetical protein
MPEGNSTINGIVKRLAGRTLTCALLVSAPGARAFAGTDLAFPRPMAIEQNVKFWVEVFATYSDRDFIVHDRDQVDRVYDVIHLRGDGDPTPEEVADINDYLKNKYAASRHHHRFVCLLGGPFAALPAESYRGSPGEDRKAHRQHERQNGGWRSDLSHAGWPMTPTEAPPSPDVDNFPRFPLLSA